MGFVVQGLKIVLDGLHGLHEVMELPAIQTCFSGAAVRPGLALGYPLIETRPAKNCQVHVRILAAMTSGCAADQQDRDAPRGESFGLKHERKGDMGSPLPEAVLTVLYPRTPLHEGNNTAR